MIGSYRTEWGVANSKIKVPAGVAPKYRTIAAVTVDRRSFLPLNQRQLGGFQTSGVYEAKYERAGISLENSRGSCWKQEITELINKRSKVKLSEADESTCTLTKIAKNRKTILLTINLQLQLKEEHHTLKTN